MAAKPLVALAIHHPLREGRPQVRTLGKRIVEDGIKRAFRWLHLKCQFNRVFQRSHVFLAEFDPGHRLKLIENAFTVLCVVFTDIEGVQSQFVERLINPAHRLDHETRAFE